MSALRALLWGLAALVATLVLWRLVRVAFWALTRPGGWIVLALGALIAVKAMDSSIAQSAPRPLR